MEKTAKQFRKRNAILECLRGTTAHPSAEELHALLKKDHPDISIASIYRNLTYFKEQGEIMSLGTVNGIERFDGCVLPHVHFACSSCGRVMDVPDFEIPSSFSKDTEDRLRCRVHSSQLIFTGTCESCQ